MFGFGNLFGPDLPRGNFSSTYRAYSVLLLPGQERQDVDKGGKIIMPPSALESLTRLHIQYPMLFKLRNPNSERVTHCGVLEFVAGEGRVYLPHWMMLNLLLEEGDLLHLQNISLPVATYTKFQPQSTDFLDISNPKAVLENALRSFACLTTGDVIGITYNDKLYEMCVQETKPGPAVSIIECDMNVEFSAPVGYQEPQVPRRAHEQHEEDPGANLVTELLHKHSFRVFSGEGNRLDGKKRDGDEEMPVDQHEIKRGIPNYNYNKGRISFIRTARTKPAAVEEKQDFSAFSGSGQSLRKKPSKK